MNRRNVVMMSLIAGAAVASQALAGSDIVAVSWTGNVYAIDANTGVGSLLGSSGFSQFNAMAKAPDGTLYASSGLATTAIIRIDPNTGAGTLVVNSNLASCRGMAFANNGRLYAIEDAGPTNDGLYSIDLGTGNKTFIGATGFPGMQGLAVDPTTGRMYGWDVGSGSGIGAGLVAIDINTGAGVDVDPNTPGSGNEVQGLGFDNAGRLYGSRDSLYAISLSTGATTFIGTGGYSDTRGMEFLGGGTSYSLRVSGQCPGTLTVSWSNATPNRQQGIVFGQRDGNTTIPTGPCQGTVLGLAGGVRLVNTVGTGSGSGSVNGQAGTGACGGRLQLVESGSCETSNVASIP